MPIGTNPSYQFEWLRPHAHSTLNETKDFLLDKFAIIGDVSQLPTFQLMLAKGFGMDMDAAVRSVRESKPENPTEHATVLETFSDSEYADLVQRHAVDVSSSTIGPCNRLRRSKCATARQLSTSSSAEQETAARKLSTRP